MNLRILKLKDKGLSLIKELKIIKYKTVKVLPFIISKIN